MTLRFELDPKDRKILNTLNDAVQIIIATMAHREGVSEGAKKQLSKDANTLVRLR